MYFVSQSVSQSVGYTVSQNVGKSGVNLWVVRTRSQQKDHNSLSLSGKELGSNLYYFTILLLSSHMWQ
jgi:hypothetical protein